jgi:hypothetical protein
MDSSSSCVNCEKPNAIYKCPGCSKRTCSVSCSASHKSVFNCSGQRNSTAHVPLNNYSWGSMMDDFVYLENAARDISKWSSSSNRNKLLSNSSGRFRYGKRRLLKDRLESFDIHMELAPLGIHRQTLNRSTFSQK